jgi:glycosyltransferase involved in cell wall biosynthesis
VTELHRRQNLTGAIILGEGLHSPAPDLPLGCVADVSASLFARLKAIRRQFRCEAAKCVPELTATHFALYALPLIPELKRLPHVVHFHGPWAEEMRVEATSTKKRLFASVAHWIERMVYSRADRLIVLSRAFRDLLHQQYHVPLSRIRVVPGGVELWPYLAAPDRLEARRRLHWPLDRPVLLSVRRLAKRMGLEMLIDAIAEVRQQLPEVLLLIGGKGPERGNLEARITQQGLEGNVRLLGFIPESDLSLAYAAADMSIVPTMALEGFGLITAESLAAGTPVLGTPVGATPEILAPLNSNLVFDAPTFSAIATRIKAVLQGNVRLPDAEKCRAHAQQYGWPAVVPQVLDVYQEAVESRKRHR